MKDNQKIANLENKINQIKETINNWKQEIMNYENKLEQIIKQVAKLKGNSKNIK